MGACLDLGDVCMDIPGTSFTVMCALVHCRTGYWIV